MPTIPIPEKRDIINIYRVRKVKEDSAIRVIEVHTVDISRPQNAATAVVFEDGWKTLGYVNNLRGKENYSKLKELIAKWESRRKEK